MAQWQQAVVGVVADTHTASLDHRAGGGDVLIRCCSGRKISTAISGAHRRRILVRSLRVSVRRAARRADANLPLTNPGTMQ